MCAKRDRHSNDQLPEDINSFKNLINNQTRPDIALENNNMERNLQARKSLSDALSKKRSLDDILFVCLNTIIELPGIDAASIYLLSTDESSFEIACHTGFSEQFVKAYGTFCYKSGKESQADIPGEPIFLPVEHTDAPLRELLIEDGLMTYGEIPVVHNGKIIAVLNACKSKADPITQKQEETLISIAGQMGDSIARALSEEALTRNEENFRNLFEKVSDFVFVYDESGIILHVNSIVLKRLGYEPGELVGNSVLSVHPPETSDLVREYLAKMLTGELDICLIPLYTKDGKQIEAETKITHGSWNGQKALFGLSRDVSERVESNRKLKRALNEAEKVQLSLGHLLEATSKVQSAKTEHEALTIVAQAIQETGWVGVGAHLFDEFEIVDSVYLGLQDSEIQYLKSISPSKEQRVKMYGPKMEKFKVSKSYFIPAERRSESCLNKKMRKGARVPQPGDSWDPYDMVYVPMIGPNNQVIGSIGFDDPTNGQRPTEETLQRIEYFAELAALTIHKLRLAIDQKKVSDALKDSEHLLSEAQSVANLGSYLLDLTTSNWHGAAVLDNLFGITKDYPHTIDSWLSILHPDCKQEMVNYFQQEVLGNKKLFDKQYLIVRQNDQAVRWVHGLGKLEFNDDGEPIRMIGTIRDITEHKLAEDALIEKEELLSATIESTADGLLVVDAEGAVKHANTRFAELWKIPETVIKSGEDDELLGYVLDQLCSPEAFIAEVQRLYGTKDESFDLLYFKDGRVFERYSSPLLHEEEVTGRVWSFRDITDRTEALISLEESERRNRALLDANPDMVFVLNSDGNYVDYFVPDGQQLLVSEDKIIGTNVDDILPKEVAELTKQAVFNALNEEGVQKFEYKLIIEGCYFDYEARGVRSGEDQVHFIIRDITEMKRLRELESRAQRLESAGAVAGQVAHDFNNLLGPLTAYPDLIRDEIEDDHPILSYLSSMENAASQMADINQQLLTLGRRGHYNQEPINLNEIVTHVISEMGIIPQTLVCDTNLETDLMNIYGGGAQIYRVISNLLYNSRDAMQDVGKLTVSTENYYADDIAISYNRVPKGEYVKLTVTDTGCGIPADIVQLIFDPFFTSKTTDKKRGSGLGLSVVDSVVRDHNGYIDLQTKIGKGTSFFLYFPITRKELGQRDSGDIPKGNETVLVVDDDDTQREVSRQLLTKLGYSVSVANSGAKAIEILKRNSHELLVLDMVMPPGIDGTDTYRSALKLKQSQKAIIVSGYSETKRLLEAQNLGAGDYVRKPLTLKSLARAVRNELDKKKKRVLKKPFLIKR